MNTPINSLTNVASKVVMVYPKSFCSNPETLESNSFQNETDLTTDKILVQAQFEHRRFQDVLRQAGIETLVFEENTMNFTPDALFPNNWFCHLPSGIAISFPMLPENRRQEFRKDIIEALPKTSYLDLRGLTEAGEFLEGTGSLILDHDNKLGYACLSSRTTEAAITEFESKTNYHVLSFNSVDRESKPIYHTNVMMALSPAHAIINLSSITNLEERNQVRELLQKTGKRIIDISYDEMENFAGNMLFLKNANYETFWICSEKAFRALAPEKRQSLESEGTFLFSDLNTIETIGGGGARCLIAEVF